MISAVTTSVIINVTTKVIATATPVESTSSVPHYYKAYDVASYVHTRVAMYDALVLAYY